LNRSQPGMIGGATAIPSAKLTGPGSPCRRYHRPGSELLNRSNVRTEPRRTR